MAAESEKRPLGLMVPPVPAGVEIPPEPPDVGARALNVAARLLAGASTFFFLSFLFAYFYLRSLDVEHMWKPAHVKPEQALGAVMVACVIVSVASAVLASRQMRAKADGWTRPVAASLLLGLVAVALQCIAYTQQKFGPTDGAYASVYCAWTAFYAIAVLGAMYWLETHLATELRARREPAHPTAGDIKEPDRLIAPGLDAATFFWAYLGGLGVVAYVVLYLV
jgi:heme/copper-type cytochrome/quinol oxidase subunit 3